MKSRFPAPLYTLYIKFLLYFVAISDKTCSFPGSPAHSVVVFTNESLVSGTVASYSCERGFELLGPSRRVCDNGVWLPEGIPFCGEYLICFLLYMATHSKITQLICQSVNPLFIHPQTYKRCGIRKSS